MSSDTDESLQEFSSEANMNSQQELDTEAYGSGDGKLACGNFVFIDDNVCENLYALHGSSVRKFQWNSRLYATKLNEIINSRLLHDSISTFYGFVVIASYIPFKK